MSATATDPKPIPSKRAPERTKENQLMKLIAHTSSRLLLLALAASLVLAVGCGKDEGGKEAGKAAVEAAEVPDKPEEVVKTAAEAIRDGKPVNAYALLPESYQKDIQGVVSHATGKLDKEFFELAANIVKTAGSAAEKHGDKIAGMVPPGAIPVDTKEAIGKAVEIIKLLDDAKLLDYDSVKKLDMAGFLAAQGPKFFEHGMYAFEKADAAEYKKFQDNMKTITTTAKKTEGDTAEVELKAGDETETIKLKKVDGRWIPEEMAGGWKDGIAEAKKGIDEGLDELNKNKAEIKPMMEMVLKALQEFEKNGDPKALEELMKMAG